jgi:hypothetical protein
MEEQNSGAESREIVPGLQLELTPEGDVVVFSVVGSIAVADVARALDMAGKLAFKLPRLVVLDFTRAARLRGLGVGLMGYYRRYVEARGGRFALVPPPDGAVEGLEPMDLRRMFAVYDSRGEAIDGVRTSRR